jgi:hypothetical protein
MKSALIIYPLVMFFIFYSDEVIKVLYTDRYMSSAIYFKIALMLNFFNVIMFAPIMLSLGETKFYSRIHIVFAFIAWIGGFIVVVTLNSPIALVCFSVLKSIMLILLSFKKTADLMKISFFSIFPLKS